MFSRLPHQFLRVIVFFLVVMAADPSWAISQTLNYRREITDKGWLVPSLSRMRVARETTIGSEDRDLIQRTYSLSLEKPITQLEKQKFCEFGNLISYTYKNKVFAIDGSCVIFVYASWKRANKRFTTKEYSAAVTRYTFYDEDGDGKFESRYNSSPGDSSFKILIPNWLLN